MTGFESKRQAAQNKMNDAADTLSIVYQRGFADGKKAAQPEQEPVRFITPPGPITQYTIPTQPLPDEIVRLAGVALHEMPRPQTDWHSCAKLVCEAVVAHGIKEQP
jgi:hypothetical protein